MPTKKQRIKRLIIKILTKIFIFAGIMGVITYIVNFPGIATEMAMMQFENDNFSYAAWDVFVNLKNFFNSYYDWIICFFAGTIIYDIYTFIKYNKGEN